MKSTEETAPITATRIAVWDLPTRLFHWTLSALIGFSWWTAEQEKLEPHMYSGYAVLTLLVFRLLWGVFGSSTARFRNFVKGPAAVLAYARDMRGWRAIGHSPLGALSAITLLGLTLLQVTTGLFNADNDGMHLGPLAMAASEEVMDAAHTVHALLFNVLLVFIAIHVAAVVFYRLFLGKKLVGPMISGRAALDPDVEPMAPGRAWVALLCLVAALGITRWIIAGAPPLG